ncbi:MAG: 3-oxoacyl-ACP reductase FabG [Bacteroidota bacterium]|nr:3-oxoacyl-ACP reductase FabG [Bacteroidota bacterium]MDP4217659.1 3-oxoacyl-ACP reductase FabG [Bacteroidota bacterium]MDP4245138.1 3-oxoacyl-ACP reductase FabG [Bacteroidota bacterium]MDP4253355.1 3-oxoacyl-ACP reductase FabG [Bacteroidota bacterium]MDP4260035.1 3-oxoacyl-ACP reductase FabG [Bacteroidota bacterium]
MKCSLVTGGSRGIGRAICIKLAEMGYYVLVNYRSNATAAEETLALVRAGGGDGELLPFDVSDKDNVQRVLGNWMEANKIPIEVLVNNAGIKDDALMLYMKDEQWEKVIHNNLDSFFYVTRLVLNGMLHNRYGRIINVVSLSGQKGLAGQTNYSAAKAGLIGATKALAQEVGRHGITVNAVAPGLIRTDMTEGMDEDKMKALIPVKRFGLPGEVAHAVGFLASPDASYITAEVVSVNGGLY